MITGANTDVEYEGRTYHVQTEDKGRENPVVESLIYCQGEILGTRRHDYTEEMAESWAAAADDGDPVPVHAHLRELTLRVLATGLAERETPAALIDLGTNGEIVIGCRDFLVCCSASATASRGTVLRQRPHFSSLASPSSSRCIWLLQRLFMTFCCDEYQGRNCDGESN